MNRKADNIIPLCPYCGNTKLKVRLMECRKCNLKGYASWCEKCNAIGPTKDNKAAVINAQPTKGG